MKLRLPQRATLDPIRPSAAVASWYYGYVSKLVQEMQKDIEKEIFSQYPMSSVQLSKLIARMGQRWEAAFSEKSAGIAQGFAARNLRSYDGSFKTALTKVGIPTEKLADRNAYGAMDAKEYPMLKPIGFQITPRIQKTIDAGVKANVDLIKSIPEQYLSGVARAVQDSVEKGRDTQGLAAELRDTFDVANRRAGFIARDQNNKITASINQSRQLDLGITEAIWVHTAASLQPRESHAEFDGETYSIDEGVDFDDGFGPVLPGEAISCGCLSRSIIPGFDD